MEYGIYKETNAKELLPDMFPWIFGPKNPLLALTKTLDRVGEGNDLSPSDYYNYMTILHKFMPEILLAMTMYTDAQDYPKDPPSVQVLVEGWETQP
jgi:hypothetical protein